MGSFRKHSQVPTHVSVHTDKALIDQSENSKKRAGLVDIESNHCAQLISSGGNEPTHCAQLELQGQIVDRAQANTKLQHHIRISLSRASCQVSSKTLPNQELKVKNATNDHITTKCSQACKALIAAYTKHHASCKSSGIEHDFVCSISLETESVEPLSSCIRILLAAVRQACTIDSVIDPHRLLMCAALVADEELPQAARWHRRDLAPGLIAAWRAVLRAIAPPPGCAAAHAAAHAACKET